MAVGRTGHLVNTGAGQTPATVSVTNSSTEIVAANPNRKWCLVTNVGNKDVYGAMGQTAEVGKGFLLARNGGSMLVDSTLHSVEALNGITSAGTSNVIIQEGA